MSFVEYRMEIPREAFKSDEDYKRAVRTSQGFSATASWAKVFIPEDDLLPFFIYLVNHTKAVGMGILHDKDISEEQAAQVLAAGRRHNTYQQRDEIDVDYVNGRPIKFRPLMKVDGGWEWEPDLYNRTSGNHGGERRLAEYMRTKL